MELLGRGVFCFICLFVSVSATLQFPSAIFCCPHQKWDCDLGAWETQATAVSFPKAHSRAEEEGGVDLTGKESRTTITYMFIHSGAITQWTPAVVSHRCTTKNQGHRPHPNEKGVDRDLEAQVTVPCMRRENTCGRWGGHRSFPHRKYTPLAPWGKGEDGVSQLGNTDPILIT